MVCNVLCSGAEDVNNGCEQAAARRAAAAAAAAATAAAAAAQSAAAAAAVTTSQQQPAQLQDTATTTAAATAAPATTSGGSAVSGGGGGGIPQPRGRPKLGHTWNAGLGRWEPTPGAVTAGQSPRSPKKKEKGQQGGTPQPRGRPKQVRLARLSSGNAQPDYQPQISSLWCHWMNALVAAGAHVEPPAWALGERRGLCRRSGGGWVPEAGHRARGRCGHASRAEENE
eukprot:COSAG04_NODE_640_length_11672_cov_32.635358_15_plen_227_part_00